MLAIRPATIDDAALLTTLIHEFAEFEHLGHEVSATESDIIRDGFGPRPKFRTVIAEWDGAAVGYALFFEFYSSFQARAGLFLDDIFVRSDFRKHGIGKSLLAHVAKIAWDEKYFCMRWEVLDWNERAIELYKALGAEFLDQWRSVLLTGQPLLRLAEKSYEG